MRGSIEWYNPARYNTTYDICGNAQIRAEMITAPDVFAKGLVLSNSFEAVKLPQEVQKLYAGMFSGLALFLAMSGFNLRPLAHPDGNNKYEAGTIFFANPKDPAVVYRKGTKALKEEPNIQSPL